MLPARSRGESEMKMIAIAAAASAVALSPVVAHAGAASDKLGQCLVDNSSPKDQAALVRWMFGALSVNPALKDFVSLSQEQRDASAKAMAATFERLMLHDCRSELITARKADGDESLRAAFETMGKRAAEQLMSDKSSQSELNRFTSYVDLKQFSALLQDSQSK